MTKKLISTLIFSSMAALPLTSVFATGVQNNIVGLYGAHENMHPILCIKNDTTGTITKWVYGASINPNDASGNKYYYSAVIRFNGCDENNNNNTYFGYISVDGNGATYHPPGGNPHITAQNVKLSKNKLKLSGNLGFTKITQPNSFPENNTPDDNWYTGVNLSGLEFSTMPNPSVIPDLSVNGDDMQPTVDFLNQGANTIRLPIRWAYLQPYGESSFDYTAFTNYFDNLVIPTLTTITSKSHNYYAILDLHSYMHYSKVGIGVAGCTGTDKCPEGSLITNPQPYIMIWSKIWTKISQNPSINSKHLMFDLVNEPAAAPAENLTAQQAFDMQVAVIKKLVSDDFDGKLLIEGVGFSGLHSWELKGNASVFTRANLEKGLTSGDNKLTKEKANYSIDNQIVINVHQYLDSNFSGTHQTCQQNIYTEGQNGFNLNGFIDYLKINQLKAMVTEFGVGNDEVSCKQPLTDLLKYFQKNAYTRAQGYGFVGWTAWSTGHGWGNYNLRITPNDWKDNILKQYFRKQSKI